MPISIKKDNNKVIAFIRRNSLQSCEEVLIALGHRKRKIPFLRGELRRKSVLKGVGDMGCHILEVIALLGDIKNLKKKFIFDFRFSLFPF
ncbi:hypothetical protein CEXT_99861 [Caerostris extrusa]|uniref:Uncharacterized protein n=1 Tax=Caerostris extrusa TaxID=172846 RepID=A0AAV4SWV6_CAEEX|nr:hypothetical protein CEXT_99861 [Caerostris extrusa]